jgi:hypothetical protein
MLNAKIVAEAIDRLSLMPYFPMDPGAKKELGKAMAEMCATDEQVQWLCRRMPQLHDKWPGEREMRAVLCSKFRPKDGLEMESDIYADGIPSENPERNLLGAALDPKRLSPFAQDIARKRLKELVAAENKDLYDAVTATEFTSGKPDANRPQKTLTQLEAELVEQMTATPRKSQEEMDRDMAQLKSLVGLRSRVEEM